MELISVCCIELNAADGGPAAEAEAEAEAETEAAAPRGGGSRVR